MDVFLAIASKRDARKYAERPLPEELVTRILDAGRLAGSARNRQPWRFLLIAERARRDELAGAVYVPENPRTAALVVAVIASGKGPVGFDCGRAAQNMMLAAWNEGVVSCPNGVADADRAAATLGLDEDERVEIVLTFGYPETPTAPERRSAEDWSDRANRRPLAELVEKR